MPSFDEAAAVQLAGGIVRPALFLRLETPSVVRAWSGIGDFEVPADAVEAAPAIYKGVGELLNWPAVQQLVNGSAERIEFAVSGVTTRVMALADEEANDVRGASALIGFVALGADWQPLTPTAWLWEGEADVVRGQRSSAEDGSAVRTITLSVGSVMTGRRRARLAFWTDVEQRRRSPTDRFCDRVALYSQGTTKGWPA